jgi:flagellar protein FlbD
MIRLTRLNNEPIVVNTERVLYVESSPDTLVTLSNGERLHVRESVEEVIERTLQYQRRVHNGRLTVVEERS